MKILIVILLVIALLLIYMAVRAAAFKPDEGQRNPQPVAVNSQKARQNLSALVKIPTVSNADFSLVDKDAFALYRKTLKELYPLVAANSEYTRIGNTAMLFKISGKSSEKPTVLMSHYDVVPVAEERWQHPPFCGEIIDGCLWGRGTLDTKITMLGIMESLEGLLKDGFVPENDLYLSFGGDEEVSGPSAPAVVNYLEEKGVKPSLVLDEGGAVVSGIFPGVTKPIAVIGIGEKGIGEITFTATSDGGHSSTPPVNTAVGKLAKAIVNVEKHLFPAQVTAPVEGMLKKVGPYSTFGLKMVFANLWFFRGILAKNIHRLGGELNAMMRTTVAFTMASGSKQANVLPNEAVAHANLRLLNNTKGPEVLARLNQLCGENAKAEFMYYEEASPYASTESEAWKKVEKAVGDTWTQAIVSPYLMIAGSDSRYFSKICRDVYKFSALELSKEERGLIHNDNERIRLENIDKAVEFFHRLIVQL